MNAILEAEPAFSAAPAKLPPTEPPPRAVDHLQVSGCQMRVDVYAPATSGRHRTLLLLHGAGGLLGDGALLRRAARSLAARDFRACVVHYFQTTGTFFATPSHVREHAAAWQAALVTIARNYAQADGPVGMLGCSLGGFLAVGAAQGTREIGAVAVWNGGLTEEHELLIPAHLPPLLVLHGGRDARVPVERADALVRLGRRAGALVESIVYANEGHAFGASAERDALDRAAEFFAARLGTGAKR